MARDPPAFLSILPMNSPNRSLRLLPTFLEPVTAIRNQYSLEHGFIARSCKISCLPREACTGGAGMQPKYPAKGSRYRVWERCSADASYGMHSALQDVLPKGQPSSPTRIQASSRILTRSSVMAEGWPSIMSLYGRRCRMTHRIRIGFSL
jgi:hypothetical protein